MTGDRYAISNADTTGSGNLFIPVSSVGSVMNNQNLSAVALQSIPKTNSPHMANQSNVNVSQQMTNMKLDQSEKMKFQSQHSLADNHLQSHQLQQFHNQPQQFQHQQQFAHHHHQPKQQSQQQQLLLKSNGYGQAPIMSDLGTKIKSEPGNHDEALLSQVPEQFQFSEMQNLYQQNSTGEHSKSNQLLPQSSQHDTFSSLTPSSEQMQQLLHHHMYVAETQTDFNNCSNGVHSDAMLQGQWYPKIQDGSQIPGSFSQEQNVQQELQQRTVRTEEAQRNNLPPEGTIANQAVVNRVVNPNSSSSAVCKSSNLTREGQFRNQQRWLLFLIHARRCASPEGKCPERNCIHVQKLIRHLERCNNALECQYARCSATRHLLNHFRRCREANCPVCVPVRNFVQTQRKSFARPDFNSDMPISVNGSCKAYDTGETAHRLTAKSSPAVAETPEDLQPSLKRMKIEQSSQAFVSETESFVSPVSVGESHIFQETQVVEQHADTIVMKPEVMEVKMEIPANAGQGSPRSTDLLKDNLDETYIQRPAIDPLTSSITAPFPKQESIKAEKDVDPAKHESTSLPPESATGSKSGKPKIKGVSLTELFTPEQVREHIIGLRQWVGQVSM